MVSTSPQGYLLRKPQNSDFSAYWQAISQLSPESRRLTNSPATFDQQEVRTYFDKVLLGQDRRDFLIVSKSGELIGETVLNEIDWEVASCNFRMVIFESQNLGQGIGTWALEETLRIAFEDLNLHRVSLEVFSFNPRAIHVYEKAGFQQEGRLRHAIKDGANHADSLIMAILEDDWRQVNHD